jgi:hypothetical protein
LLGLRQSVRIDEALAVKVIIDLSDDNRVTVVGDGNPFVICESIKRMASQICAVSEIYSGEEFTSVQFADALYLSDDDSD